MFWNTNLGITFFYSATTLITFCLQSCSSHFIQTNEKLQNINKNNINNSSDII